MIGSDEVVPDLGYECFHVRWAEAALPLKLGECFVVGENKLGNEVAFEIELDR